MLVKGTVQWTNLAYPQPLSLAPQWASASEMFVLHVLGCMQASSQVSGQQELFS